MKNKELEELLTKVKQYAKDRGDLVASTPHVFAVILKENKKYCNMLDIDFSEYETIFKLEYPVTDVNTKNAVVIDDTLQTYIELSTTVADLLYTLMTERNDGMDLLLCITSSNRCIRLTDSLSKQQSTLRNMPKYLTNLNTKKYVTNPAIGREVLLEEIEKTLLKMNKPNVLLVGEAGVGKTAVVEGLVYRIQNGEVSNRLKDAIVFGVATSTLVAGTKYRGEFEERVDNLCKFLSTVPNSILFVDEMHTTLNAGKSDGAIDMANILKPYLARGEIRMIGATTLTESEIIKSDSAYTRRFTTMLVKEPLQQTSLKILVQSLPKFEKFFGIKIDENLMPYLVKESNKLNGKFPDVCIDLLENVCADTIWNEDKDFNKKDIDRVVERLLEKQDMLIKAGEK